MARKSSSIREFGVAAGINDLDIFGIERPLHFIHLRQSVCLKHRLELGWAYPIYSLFDRAFTARPTLPSAIKQSDDTGVASESVRHRIREIIEGENRARPLSDEAVAQVLRGEGVEVARRTVAKYRTQLEIPVASARRMVA